MGKLSGPGAELFLRLSISISMSCSENWISTKHGRGELSRLKNVVGLISGSVSFGFEKVEAY